jgi:hypothetical protein
MPLPHLPRHLACALPLRASRLAALGLLLGTATIACGNDGSAASTAPATATPRFQAEVWADNWFAMYVGETKVGEDRVPITTERSFNSERFTFDGSYPLELNLVVKDYKQDDSGLEYIGLPNQQMGDGGLIFQVTDRQTGTVVATSNAGCRCLVIHKAPLNPACEKSAAPLGSCQFRSDPEPAGWKLPGFSTAGWEAATEYTPAQIGVKEGYYDISWTAAARLIWTSDLKADNTLLCKLRVTAP